MYKYSASFVHQNENHGVLGKGGGPCEKESTDTILCVYDVIGVPYDNQCVKREQFRQFMSDAMAVKRAVWLE